MRIAIASGKGGTGKTLLATGLARVLTDSHKASVSLLDCDVEEPNDHLFLAVEVEQVETVSLPVPRIDAQRCKACGRCAQVCAFHALALVRDKVLFFPQLCHSCGSCVLQCPEHAIAEVARPLGRLEFGRAGEIAFGQGVLEVGQAMATPLIRGLKERAAEHLPECALTLLDAPPGNACPVVETLRGADYAILVTEPTPFGLHDLQIAVELAGRELGIPIGVVVNRVGLGDRGVEEYCEATDLQVLLRLPFDRRIAEAYACGKLWVDALPEYRAELLALYERVVELKGALL